MHVHKYPAGTAIAFSSGEYSDFSYIGHVVTMRECDLPALIEEHKSTYVAKNKWDTPDSASFVAWLVISGYAFPAEVTEVHIGSYGELKLGT